MTRKRFKKLLMGRYKFSRNQAENISRWGDYTITINEDSDLIANRICVLKDGFFDKLKSREDYVSSMWNDFSKLVADGIDRRQVRYDR